MSKKKNRAARHKKRDKKQKNKIKSHGQKSDVEVVDESALVAYDESLLERARTQWQFGDWQRLAQLDKETLHHHPQRAKLALLAAAGHFQLGETNEAHRYLRLAQDWGCRRQLAAQILVSGTHNSLACANLLMEREEKGAEHFHHAVRRGGVLGDPVLLTDVRVRSQRNWLKIDG